MLAKSVVRETESFVKRVTSDFNPLFKPGVKKGLVNPGAFYSSGLEPAATEEWTHLNF
jgi:hypothetical protein